MRCLAVRSALLCSALYLVRTYFYPSNKFYNVVKRIDNLHNAYKSKWFNWHISHSLSIRLAFALPHSLALSLFCPFVLLLTYFYVNDKIKTVHSTQHIYTLNKLIRTLFGFVHLVEWNGRNLIECWYQWRRDERRRYYRQQSMKYCSLIKTSIFWKKKKYFFFDMLCKWVKHVPSIKYQSKDTFR